MSLLIPGTNSIKDTGYDVANSLRFNGGDSEDLERTPSSSGNNNKNTLSVWLKRSRIDEEDFIIYGFGGSANRCKITFLDNNKLQINTIVSSSNNLVYETNRLFRDVSAWYHIVIAFDSTLSTAGDRVRLYINGTEETSFSTETHMGQNTSNFLSTSGTPVYIGSQASGNYFDGYMAEFVFIDGQQLDATSFGEFDSDSPTIWKPKDVSGLTFGTNGFHLDFENASSLGADVSGNGNNFTVQNLTSVDQSTDTCTNNFATLNPLSSAVTLSEGNLQFSGTYNAKSTFAVSSGKWYLECKVTNNNTYNPMLGFAQVGSANIDNPAGTGYAGNTPNSYHFQRDGKIYANNSSTETQTGLTTIAQNDIVGLALDLDSGTKTVKWYKNGSLIATQNITETASEPYIFWTYASGSQAGEGQVNFGGTNTYSISSGNSDANGYGNFEYAVPSGYYSLNTKNLAEFG